MDIREIAEIQKDFFNQKVTLDYRYRLGVLNVLKEAIKKHEEEIMDALYEDFAKSKFETYETEIGIVYSEIDHMMKNLKKYMKPKFKFTELPTWPSYGKIYKEPFGSVLIISPWNYPFMLSMIPLIGAIAAGNTAVIKPSTDVPKISSVMEKMISEAFEEEYITVINGTNEDTHILLSQRFDYIFFTGGASFGKRVMQKAAENLIPVTLELGGKSPVIVDKDANLKKAAKRIAWGKLINAGQTCVAPDYALVHSNIKDEFIGYLKEEIIKMYGENPLNSVDLPNIVNERNYKRLLDSLIGENIIFGGEHDNMKLKIAPTLIDNPTIGSPLETEEIFGPILPILSFNELDNAIDYIGKKEKPLALYYFGKDKKRKLRVLNEISFGGGCFNETIMHIASNSLPFGGVGHSGIGGYHGYSSFKTFSHYKSMLHRLTNIDIKQKFPPYTEKNFSFLKKILK